MNYFKLASIIVMLMVSVSANDPLSANLTSSANNSDALQSTMMKRSIALFMPSSILVITDEQTTNEEGC
ncbi:MAG: hypothetical protein OQK72_01495 [Gammaproteobacteria bacterium]|nr:hypothetical protein [Gammaproteobacteria bacterium]MCW9056903.1 hypothetical protein [Gammaproteobacteria bacterium]